MCRYLSLLLFIGLVFESCNQSSTIDSEEAIILLNNDAFYFLDVRTAEEHKNRSTPDTDHIPVQELEQRMINS